MRDKGGGGPKPGKISMTSFMDGPQEPDAEPGAALPAAGAAPVVLDTGGGQGRDLFACDVL